VNFFVNYKNKILTWITYPFHLFLLTSIIVICGWIAAFIATFGVDLPWGDSQVTTAFFAFHVRRGGVEFGELFVQHNEHRILFTKILTAINTAFFNWDTRVEMLVSFILAFLTALLILDLLRRQNSQAAKIAAIPVFLLIFAIRGYVNWLVGFQSQWYFVVFFSVFSFWWLSTHPIRLRNLVITGIFALCATWSLFSGLACFPIILILMVIRGYRRWQHYLFWFLFSAVNISIYLFVDYRLPKLGGGQAIRIDSSFNYVFAFLGNPFFSKLNANVAGAQWVGCVGLLFFVVCGLYLFRREQTRALLTPWLGIAGLSVGMAVMAALGRGQETGQTPFQPLSSRYVTGSVPFWIALVAVWLLIAYEVDQTRLQRLLAGFGATGSALLVAFFAYGTYSTVTNPEDAYPYTAEIENCVALNSLTDPADPCIKLLNPNIPEIINLNILRILRKYHLSLFARPHNLELHLLPAFYDLTDKERGEPSYQTYTINGKIVPVLRQDPPSYLRQRFHIPDLPGDIQFKSAVWVDTANARRPGIDGVLFRLRIKAQGNKGRFRYDSEDETMLEYLFNPHTDDKPIPIQFSLAPYKGKNITLTFETEGRFDSTFDWGMWVNPSIVTTSLQEAEKAP